MTDLICNICLNGVHVLTVVHLYLCSPRGLEVKSVFFIICIYWILGLCVIPGEGSKCRLLLVMLQVLNEIAQHKIKIYEFPDCEDEEEQKAHKKLRVC